MFKAGDKFRTTTGDRGTITKVGDRSVWYKLEGSSAFCGISRAVARENFTPDPPKAESSTYDRKFNTIEYEGKAVYPMSPSLYAEPGPLPVNCRCQLQPGLPEAACAAPVPEYETCLWLRLQLPDGRVVESPVPAGEGWEILEHTILSEKKNYGPPLRSLDSDTQESRVWRYEYRDTLVHNLESKRYQRKLGTRGKYKMLGALFV